MRLNGAVPLLAGLLLAVQVPTAGAADQSLIPVPTPDATPDRPDEPPTPEVWYGYKILLADAAAVGVWFVGIQTESVPLAVPLGAVFLAAPTMHLIEGEGARALGSLGLRLAMPVAGAAIGGWLYNRGNQSSGECDCMGGIFAVAGGAALGLVGAMVVDAAFLGWRPRPEAEGTLSVIPSIALHPSGGSLGVAGRF